MRICNIPKLVFSTLCVVLAQQSLQSAIIIYENDFSTSSVSGGHRLFLGNSDSVDWQASFDTSWGNVSLWNTVGGALNNPVTETATTDSLQRANEKSAAYLTSVAITNPILTELKISFDYSVGVGSSVTFHIAGLQNATGIPPYTVTNPQIFSLHTVNGNITNGSHLDANFTDINLLDGSEFTGGVATGQTFTEGSGTFSTTLDMSGYSISNIASLDYIAVAFSINSGNTDGTGAVSIDNFSVAAIPEPSLLTLLSLASLALIGHRRRC